MPLSAKVVRSQLNLLKPLLCSTSLKTTRKAQNKIGELMEAKFREQVTVKHHAFPLFQGAWIMPTDERRQGVILYLHGGGYTCGNLEYALGFGANLCAQSGARVFCAAYRLAPEAPFPAAVEDGLEAYRYLLSKGYRGKQITVCGESAGGGLCYALCLKLKELGLELPCGIIAISPWVDLTLSGASFQENAQVDPSMDKGLLEFYAACYTDDRLNPLASPTFGDLTGMPPSLIFAGNDEILRSDAVDLHNKLLAAGAKSRLRVKPERWHAYPLYGLAEDREEFERINRFLNQNMGQENKLRWLRLDNAAKIYPAARRQNWSNVFRLSVTLKEKVDVPVLQAALDVTVRRFPSIAARLRRGAFWYYLQQLERAPLIKEESSYPLVRMTKGEVRQCAFRVIVYQNRIAVEIFHSLTDGNGALVFLKSLLAEYLQQKHGICVPAEHGVLGRLEAPSPEELEDSFLRYAGEMQASRRGSNAWRVSGTKEESGFLHVTCFRLSVQQVLEKAHSYGVSLTAFLSAAMMLALQNMQAEQVPERKRRKPIKLLVPVNLRRLFPSKTMRNFAMYCTPEIMPKLGHYSFEEICRQVHHCMGAQITPKYMSMMIATNVSSETMLAVKLMPLFMKNAVMRIIFDMVGERKSCLSLSNLGAIRLPDVMTPYVERMDFILGVQSAAPYNCGVLSFGDTLYLNFIRNIKESDLETHFYRVLQDMGLQVLVESNQSAQ